MLEKPLDIGLLVYDEKNFIAISRIISKLLPKKFCKQYIWQSSLHWLIDFIPGHTIWLPNLVVLNFPWYLEMENNLV